MTRFNDITTHYQPPLALEGRTAQLEPDSPTLGRPACRGSRFEARSRNRIRGGCPGPLKTPDSNRLDSTNSLCSSKLLSEKSFPMSFTLHAEISPSNLSSHLDHVTPEPHRLPHPACASGGDMALSCSHDLPWFPHIWTPVPLLAFGEMRRARKLVSPACPFRSSLCVRTLVNVAARRCSTVPAMNRERLGADLSDPA
ncbi:hypothetical protein HPB51_000219 [Rhipicephalus microplus]|uniref:Uncharacterized protein n=1 Tax=Rhipicephalus microplus TaxID=6941 RepID=A0A9J6DXF4_RHIMP|nr:hypothetical protein HPB51_000219 [Rhipicephalus microplus]